MLCCGHWTVTGVCLQLMSGQRSVTFDDSCSDTTTSSQLAAAAAGDVFTCCMKRLLLLTGFAGMR